MTDRLSMDLEMELTTGKLACNGIPKSVVVQSFTNEQVATLIEAGEARWDKGKGENLLKATPALFERLRL